LLANVGLQMILGSGKLPSIDQKLGECELVESLSSLVRSTKLVGVLIIYQV